MERKASISVTYSGCLGDQYTGLDTQSLVSPKSIFQVFLFQLYVVKSYKKYVKVVINGFTMHLITSK